MDLMMLVPPSTGPLNLEVDEDVPCTTHSCKIPPAWDELKNVIEGDDPCTKARRWFRRKCLVSREHPDTKFFLRSKTAILYEYERHATTYIYMIHPFSEFRVYWESTMIVATVVALLLIPYRCTFFFELPRGDWLFIIAALNCILMTDVVLCFFTGYHEPRTNIIVLEPRLIAREYLTGWFLVDLLSSFPMEVLAIMAKPTPDNIQMYSYFQILKILRLRVVVTYGHRLQRVYQMTFQIHKSLQIVILTTIVLHWAACAEYYVSSTVQRISLQSEKPHQNWTNLKHVRDTSALFKYVTSLYRAVAALANCLKFDPQVAVEDVVFDVILSIFGRVANIYMIAQWFQLMNTSRGTDNSYMRLLPQLHEYMRDKELPIEIQKRLTTYYDYCTRRGLDIERNIMSQLSRQLRMELIILRTRKLVGRVSFFKCLPESVLSRIAMALHAEVFLTNDILIKAGTPGDRMYFIVSGTVAIYSSLGKEVSHLADGAHFGEIALIMKNELCIASVVAAEICELYVLTREDFQQAIEQMPNLMHSLQKLVLERWETTLFLGELYRLEGNIPEVYKPRSKSSSHKSRNKTWNYL